MEPALSIVRALLAHDREEADRLCIEAVDVDPEATIRILACFCMALCRGVAESVGVDPADWFEEAATGIWSAAAWVELAED